MLGRFGQTEYDVVILDSVLIFRDGAARILLLGFVVASEVRADGGPGATLIGRTENKLRGVINHVGIVLRNENRHGPGITVFLLDGGMTVYHHGPFLDALRLAGAAIEAREDGPLVVGVNDVRIARVGDDVAAFAAADGIPIAAIDVAVVAAGADADRGIVLLGAIDSVEKIIVGGDVIKLRGWLVALRGPIFPAVD